MEALVARPPIFINCRDRLTGLERLLSWLEESGCSEIYLIDNDSRYEPLLELYRRTSHTVVSLRRNLGHLALFVEDDLLKLARRRAFVYTDPDVVPIDECPADLFERCAELLERHVDVRKVGPGLRIDDLPRCYAHRRRVRFLERRFWADEIEPGVFRAQIDTTFALYRRGTTDFGKAALRTGYPYVARHLPWYADSRRPTAEDLFYAARVARDMPEAAPTSYWSAGALPTEIRRATSRRAQMRWLRSRIALRTRLRRALRQP